MTYRRQQQGQGLRPDQVWRHKLVRRTDLNALSDHMEKGGGIEDIASHGCGRSGECRGYRAARRCAAAAVILVSSRSRAVLDAPCRWAARRRLSSVFVTPARDAA